ncbi:MAG: threonylcarbamoyl-AMP synthase [Ktedonobacteraceae bacterium]|nr:threonylcarbamoyl-AMP synthase [Ktedonobacteraceae bacterium]MBO0791889.1 threonylcarbamoyl-AMP synthase [Ktedonobacteraceae bacterium]
MQRETEIIQINAIEPEPAIIERAARLLCAGEMVVFPTETVYGLGANALDARASERIFAAKERPFSDPLISHIADESELELLVGEASEAAQKLAHAFWPGPLTLILPAGPRVPGLITAGLPSVAVRMPRHPVALALIRAAGFPIAAPSANRFMHVSPTTAQHAYTDLRGRVPLILDGGPCAVGVESTILDLCAAVPTILRPGGISLEELRSVLPETRPPAPRKARFEHEAQKAPGQMLIHYAPATPAFLFEGTPAAMRAAMLAEVVRRQQQGERVGVLVADEDIATFHESGACVYSLGSTPEQIATRLFAGLRVLEESGAQIILCRNFEERGLGMAIRDRLLKATGGRVIRVDG